MGHAAQDGFRTNVGHENGKSAAVDVRYKVVWAAHSIESPGYGGEGCVANLTPIGLVNLIELIELEQDQAAGDATPTCLSSRPD